MTKDKTEPLKLIMVLVTGVGIIGALFNMTELTNQIIQWLVSIFISMALSISVGSLIEACSGDILKKIFINIKIVDKINIPIPLFLITTYFIKIWLFG